MIGLVGVVVVATVLVQECENSSSPSVEEYSADPGSVGNAADRVRDVLHERK